MKISKKQGAYAAVLGLAAVGFIADRTVFAPAEPGAAEEYAVARPANKGPGNAPARPVAAARAEPAQKAVDPAFSERLEAVASAQAVLLSDVRDAFVPSPKWVSLQRQAASEEKPADNSVEMFKQKHRLTGILSGGGTPSAIIDGRPLRVGQHLDGFALVSISRKNAVLIRGELQVELVLDLGEDGLGRAE